MFYGSPDLWFENSWTCTSGSRSAAAAKQGGPELVSFLSALLLQAALAMSEFSQSAEGFLIYGSAELCLKLLPSQMPILGDSSEDSKACTPHHLEALWLQLEGSRQTDASA
jgi:hypothetical protein